MTRKSIIATAALGTTLALGVVGLGAAVLPGMAGAQTTDTTQVAAAGAAQGGQAHPRLRHLARQEGKLAADTIGIPATDLRDAVKAGQSIAEVAEAHGVSADTVVGAVVDDVSSKLDQAVTDGKVTQERADTVKQRLPERITDLVNRHRVAGQPAG